MKQSFGSLQGVIWGLLEIIYIIEESLERHHKSLEINQRVIKDSFGCHHGVIRDSLERRWRVNGKSLESHWKVFLESLRSQFVFIRG